VWVKVGAYRWWPAVVLHPTKVSSLAHTSPPYIIHTVDLALVTPDPVSQEFVWYRYWSGHVQISVAKFVPDHSYLASFYPLYYDHFKVFFPSFRATPEMI
jgi:hypothetical protein